MAPLPILLSEEAKAQIAGLERRRKDLSEFQIQRLRSCKGPLVTQQQYAAEIREDIELFSRNLDTLELAVDDQRGERNRRELGRIVEEFREVLVNLRKESRSALLTSKRAIDEGRLSNREELFSSSAVHEKQTLNEKVTEDALMQTSNNVTDALQRTIALMQGELEKSVLSSQLLDTSTAALQSTSSTHDVLDSFMVTSKHLITALEKSDWLDRILIFAALFFFILVVLFILKQRLVDRTIRIAFFWTRFLPSFGSSSSVSAGKQTLAVQGSALVSSVTLTATGVLSAASLSSASVIQSLTASPVPLATPSTGEDAGSPSVVDAILVEISDDMGPTCVLELDPAPLLGDTVPPPPEWTVVDDDDDTILRDEL